jgi:formamidopyrimidine-DNA glycosylase
MPELPEVETIARFLRDGGRGQAGILRARIAGVGLGWSRTLAISLSTEELEARLVGQTIRGIGRRAKFLCFELDFGVLLFHLRMSGDLVLRPQNDPPGKYDRFWLDLADGRRLAFEDPRKFGRVWWAAEPGEVLAELGPEPLNDDFTPERLYALLRSRSRQLKPSLMDQSLIAGLGNIYTDEALHRAKLHPLRLTSGLSRDEAYNLWQAIRDVLTEGIARQGASIDWVYRGGDFQNAFRVYQRTGEPCPNCGAPIERITVGQRGTHFCPVCQPFIESGT